MGGCVASVMSARNSMSNTPNEHIARVKAHGAQSVEIGTSEAPNEGRIRRSPSMKDMTLEEMNKIYYGGKEISLAALMRDKCVKFGKRFAIAWRPIDKIEKAEVEENGAKKMWEFVHLKATSYMTYEDWWTTVVAFGNGLASLGIQPGAKIGLYEETRWEWLVSCYGAWTQGMTGVTVYANLGEDALEYAIREAELNVVIVNAKSVKNLVKTCKKAGIPIPTLIYLDNLPADVDTSDLKIFAWDKLVETGRAKGADSLNLPTSPDDVALIMYTSGTTGDPKGVVLSQGNVVAAVLGFQKRLALFLGEQPAPDETYIAYLPLAHILEFAAENVLLIRGSMVGYGTPRTLTSTSAKPHGDLQEFKPVFLAGVPRIYDTIKKAVEAKLPDGFRRRIFDKAYAERVQALAKGLDTPYWDSKVFATPRAMLGGRCKALVSGGAPMSAKTQEFLQVVFGVSVGQGYGLTETCACCTIQRYWDTQTENIGGLLSCCEVKLRDVEDWKHTDPKPRGEICIRGPIVTKGYYKQPEKTKEAYSPDGWFYTGDVGMITDDGTFKIVGRVKALAKNAFGEYVALDALESTYVMNDLVIPNGVCILVDSHKAYIAALVLTDRAKATKFAQSQNIAGTWPDFLQDPLFQKKAAESLAQTAKAAGKKPFELVKYVRVLSDEWTPENGVLTAAMKLKRRVIDTKYADIIKQLFAAE